MKEEAKAQSYTLYTENGHWLGQVVLTSNGMFASVTDYGNFSHSWSAIGDRTFKEFLIGLSEDYFASKMVTGMAYMFTGKKLEAACKRYAEKILPALKKVLKEELEKGQKS